MLQSNFLLQHKGRKDADGKKDAKGRKDAKTRKGNSGKDTNTDSCKCSCPSGKSSKAMPGAPPPSPKPFTSFPTYSPTTDDPANTCIKRNCCDAKCNGVPFDKIEAGSVLDKCMKLNEDNLPSDEALFCQCIGCNIESCKRPCRN